MTRDGPKTFIYVSPFISFVHLWEQTKGEKDQVAKDMTTRIEQILVIF